MQGMLRNGRARAAIWAFTIWELLCILAVIVFLVSLMLPALNRARSMAVKSVCMSYIKMYGTAGKDYLDDNGGCFPNGPEEWLFAKASDNSDHPMGCRWHDPIMAAKGDLMADYGANQGRMWPYLELVYPCPVFSRYASGRGCENPWHNPDLDIVPQLSYSINGYLGSTREGGVLRDSQVRDASKVFFFGEENNWTLRPDHPRYPADWLRSPLSTTALDDTVLLIGTGGQVKDCFATYHISPGGDLNRGSGHAVFVDGHVEPITVEDQVQDMRQGRGSRFLKKSVVPGGNLQRAWASSAAAPGGWETP